MYVSNTPWNRNTQGAMKNAQQSYLQTETFDFVRVPFVLFVQNEFNFIPRFARLVSGVPSHFWFFAPSREWEMKE